MYILSSIGHFVTFHLCVANLNEAFENNIHVQHKSIASDHEAY